MASETSLDLIVGYIDSVSGRLDLPVLKNEMVRIFNRSADFLGGDQDQVLSALEVGGVLRGRLDTKGLDSLVFVPFLERLAGIRKPVELSRVNRQRLSEFIYFGQIPLSPMPEHWSNFPDEEWMELALIAHRLGLAEFLQEISHRKIMLLHESSGEAKKIYNFILDNFNEESRPLDFEEKDGLKQLRVVCEKQIVAGWDEGVPAREEELVPNILTFEPPSEWEKDAQFEMLARCSSVRAIDMQGISQVELERIASDFPKITSVSVQSGTFVTVPDRLVDRLVLASFYKCPNIVSVELPNTEALSVFECRGVTSVVGPKAIKVRCHNTSVEILNLPIARTVECHDNPLLVSLICPEAKVAHCTGNDALSKIKWEQVEEVTLSNVLFESLVFSSAKKVRVSNCENLLLLDCSKANEVYCSVNLNLKVVNCPSASQVDCCGNSSLTSAVFPEAFLVVCIANPVLVSLDCPNATTICFNRNDSATTLELPKALNVECRFNESLKTVSLPQARTIMVENNPSLETVAAPLAEKITHDGSLVGGFIAKTTTESLK